MTQEFLNRIKNAEKLTIKLATQLIAEYGIEKINSEIGYEAIKNAAYARAERLQDYANFAYRFRKEFEKHGLYVKTKKILKFKFDNKKFKHVNADGIPFHRDPVSLKNFILEKAKKSVNKCEVAKELNISRMTLARICNQFGITDAYNKLEYRKLKKDMETAPNTVLKAKATELDSPAIQLFLSAFPEQKELLTKLDVAFIKARYKAFDTGDFNDLYRHSGYRRIVELKCNKLGWIEESVSDLTRAV